MTKRPTKEGDVLMAITLLLQFILDQNGFRGCTRILGNCSGGFIKTYGY